MNGTHEPSAHENPQQPAVPPGGPAYGPGYAQPAQVPVAATHRDPRAKSPVAACVLSAVPGLGQIYVGYYLRGFINAAVVALIFSLLVSTGASDDGDFMLLPLLLIFMIFFWLYNVIDAGRRAALYNEALAGNQEIELPQDLKMPGIGGSIFGGLVLVAVGAMLLAHTRFDVSLDWVADWWPALGILAGLYLLVKGIYERLASSGEGGD